MLLQGLVRENPGGTDLHQIAAELALEDAVLMAAKVDLIAQCQRVEITASRIVAIKPGTAVALDAAVHLVIDKRAQVLVVKRALSASVTAIGMPCHYRHILEVAFAALVAHWTIMGVVDHQPFDHAGAELPRLRIVDGDASAIRDWRHASHHNLAALVILVLELLDRTLTTGAHRTQRGVPAKIWQVESQRETLLQQVVTILGDIGPAIDMDRRHFISRGNVSHGCAGRNHPRNA